MTDFEFYQKALSCQSRLMNRLSESRAYGKYWGDSFCLKEMRKAIEEFYSDDQAREVFTLENLTKQRAQTLGFKKASEDKPDLYLFPLWFVFFLPFNTEIVYLNGSRLKFTENTHLYNRFGCVAFGIELKE